MFRKYGVFDKQKYDITKEICNILHKKHYDKFQNLFNTASAKLQHYGQIYDEFINRLAENDDLAIKFFDIVDLQYFLKTKKEINPNPFDKRQQNQFADIAIDIYHPITVKLIERLCRGDEKLHNKLLAAKIDNSGMFGPKPFQTYAEIYKNFCRYILLDFEYYYVLKNATEKEPNPFTRILTIFTKFCREELREQLLNIRFCREYRLPRKLLNSEYVDYVKTMDMYKRSTSLLTRLIRALDETIPTIIYEYRDLHIKFIEEWKEDLVKIKDRLLKKRLEAQAADQANAQATTQATTQAPQVQAPDQTPQVQAQPDQTPSVETPQVEAQPAQSGGRYSRKHKNKKRAKVKRRRLSFKIKKAAQYSHCRHQKRISMTRRK